MVEDLDELIQDLENKYISQDINNPTTQSRNFQRSELSLDIHEILSLDVEENFESTEKLEETSKSEKIKCCPVCIGGTEATTGCSNLISPKVCSELHCHRCDFKVTEFQNYEWMGKVSYLFLRTNMPNFEKILVKLRKKNGSVAYACHCVSYSSEKLRPSPLPQTLPWFCRGHSV